MTNKIDLQQYLPLTFKIAGKFPLPYQTEIESELFIKMHKLQSTFDPSKGKFETYCYLPLLRHAVAYFNENRLDSISLNQSINKDDDFSELIDLIEAPTDVEKEIIKHDILSNRTLTQTEKFIQRKFYHDGLTAKEIQTKYFKIHGIKNPATIRKILKK